MTKTSWSRVLSNFSAIGCFGHSECSGVNNCLFNPFIPGGLVYSYQIDGSIIQFKGVCFILFVIIL